LSYWSERNHAAKGLRISWYGPGASSSNTAKKLTAESMMESPNEGSEMSLIYGLEEFKKKLQSCVDAGDVRIVHSVIVDQVSHMKRAIEELRLKLEEKESRLLEINLDDYKAATVERIRELTGK
jgi:hypothetical protein